MATVTKGGTTLVNVLHAIRQLSPKRRGQYTYIVRKDKIKAASRFKCVHIREALLAGHNKSFKGVHRYIDHTDSDKLNTVDYEMNVMNTAKQVRLKQ